MDRPADRVKVLLLKLKHIGDTLILTPTIAAIRQCYPDSEIWVVVRDGTQSILQGTPGIAQVLTTAPAEKPRRRFRGVLNDIRLLRRLRSVDFDYVFELTDGDRGRILSCMSRARFRATGDWDGKVNAFWRRMFDGRCDVNWDSWHRVEKDFYTVHQFLPLDTSVPPLQFEPSCDEPFPGLDLRAPYVVLHPATRWKRKEWPEERWVRLAQALLRRFERIVVSCGPAADEMALAERLRQRIGHRACTTRGRASWSQLSGIMRSAALFVGVDTAAMHLAAACQCPVVGILGPTVQRQWRPWGVAHELVMPEPNADDLPHPQALRAANRRRTQDVPHDAVLAACERLLAARGRGLGSALKS